VADTTELLWSRIAVLSARSGKYYAMLDRSAWGEPGEFLFNIKNLTEFTGRLVSGDVPDKSQNKTIRIGFYHPLFTGAVAKNAVVEVIPNISKICDVDYIAIGTGVDSLIVAPFCFDQEPPVNPCEAFSCPDDAFVWAWGPAGYTDSRDDFTFFDATIDNPNPGVNQFPADFELYGYTGDRSLPLNNRGMKVRWTPGAFILDFQPCPSPPSSGGPSGDPATIPYCCWLLWALQGLYGDEIKALINRLDPDLMEICKKVWAGE
jgi:hypothetical protein